MESDEDDEGEEEAARRHHHVKLAVVKGVEYSQRQCYIKSLELDPEDASTWFHIGKTLTLTSDMTAATSATTSSPSPPTGHQQPVFQVNALTYYTKQQCFVKALELLDEIDSSTQNIDDEYFNNDMAASLWYELYTILFNFPNTVISGDNDANEEGGRQQQQGEDTSPPPPPLKSITIGREPFTARQCLVKSIELNPGLEHAWVGLAFMLAEPPSYHPKPVANSSDDAPPPPPPAAIGGEEAGKYVSEGMMAQDCFCKVIELNPDNSVAWYHLGNIANAGGKVVHLHQSAVLREGC